ncbi:hypothetical protein [Bradyrhizobium sp.]
MTPRTSRSNNGGQPFEGDRIKRIDVYFGATYQNGAFVRQREN